MDWISRHIPAHSGTFHGLNLQVGAVPHASFGEILGKLGVAWSVIGASDDRKRIHCPQFYDDEFFDGGAGGRRAVGAKL